MSWGQSLSINAYGNFAAAGNVEQLFPVHMQLGWKWKDGRKLDSCHRYPQKISHVYFSSQTILKCLAIRLGCREHSRFDRPLSCWYDRFQLLLVRYTGDYVVCKSNHCISLDTSVSGKKYGHLRQSVSKEYHILTIALVVPIKSLTLPLSRGSKEQHADACKRNFPRSIILLCETLQRQNCIWQFCLKERKADRGYILDEHNQWNMKVECAVTLALTRKKITSALSCSLLFCLHQSVIIILETMLEKCFVSC